MQRDTDVLPGAAEFRHFLVEDYEACCRRNPRYSLRSYATRLGVDSSTLSKLLKGQRSVSYRMFGKISTRLRLDPRERTRFAGGPRSTTRYRQLAQDNFRAISDWYHFAIIELMRTRGFRPEPRWIARELGITTSVVNAAVERLRRLGWIAVDEQGRWQDLAGHNTTDDPNEREAAFAKMQIQLLQKAIEAVGTLPFSQRDQSSMTVAMHPKRLPEVKARIDAFRRELTDFVEADADRTHVYSLLISYFPLSGNHSQKGEPS